MKAETYTKLARLARKREMEASIETRAGEQVVTLSNLGFGIVIKKAEQAPVWRVTYILNDRSNIELLAGAVGATDKGLTTLKTAETSEGELLLGIISALCWYDTTKRVIV